MLGIIMKTLHACFVESNQAPAEEIDAIDAKHDVGGAVRRRFDSIFNYTTVIESAGNNGGMGVSYRIGRSRISLGLQP